VGAPPTPPPPSSRPERIVIRHIAYTAFDAIKVAGIVMAIFYVLLVAAFIVGVATERLHRARVNRIRFEHIERTVTDFRRELDSVDLAYELRRTGRAA
jgi:hypothetical protein